MASHGIADGAPLNASDEGGGPGSTGAGSVAISTETVDAATLLRQDFLGRQPLLALINLAIAAITAAVLAGAAPMLAVLGWFGTIVAAQLTRLGLWHASRRATGPGRRRAARLLTLASAATGLAWGTAGLVPASYATPPASMMVPFVLAGMCAGAIVVLPAHPPAFFAFIWPALLPYAIRLAADGEMLTRAMALAAILYGAALSAAGWQAHRTLRRAAELNLQNAHLVARLDLARRGLEATVTQRTAELRATNVALLREVAERRRTEDRVRHLLAHDPVTNLPNRLMLLDRLGQALARSRRNGTRTAVMLLDVDRFKDVNDSFGHPAGDQLLRSLAGRMRAAIRASDTLARFGGDEFALVSPDLTEGGEAMRLAGRVIEACHAPFELEGGRVQVTISLGIALCPEHGADADALIRAADAALYHAKGEGRDRVMVYSQTIRSAQELRLRVEGALRDAILRHELQLAYQPRFDLTNRRMIAVEALLRWRHPEFAALPTEQVIAVAEASGLIGEIGRWVLGAACTQARQWRDAGHPIRIAVNLSALEFRHPDLPRQISGTLERCRLAPEQLELEITESAYMEREAEAPHPGLEEVRRLGVRVAIDDFGTGWSSLAYLKWLPFDVIKIDRSFVRNLGDDPRDEAIVATIVTLARQLDKTVVAEGVESEVQLRTLRRLGCHEAQGFLLGRPERPEAIAARLAA